LVFIFVRNVIEDGNTRKEPVSNPEYPLWHVKPHWNKRRSRCWKRYIQSNTDTCKHQNCKLGL